MKIIHGIISDALNNKRVLVNNIYISTFVILGGIAQHYREKKHKNKTQQLDGAYVN